MNETKYTPPTPIDTTTPPPQYKQQILIKRSILPQWAGSRFPPKFIADRTNNTADYIAQIIHQLGYPTALKSEDVRLVSDLKMPIPNFVRICRGKFVQTDLCCNIMVLVPSPESEAALAHLLRDLFTITFVD